MSSTSGNFWREVRRRPLAIVCVVFLVVLFVACVFAPVTAPYDPQLQDLLNVHKRPSLAHLLGTDQLGRDVLSRLLYGGRVTMLLASWAVVIFVVIGVPIGVLSGYLGGRVDRAIMWVCDLVIALPGLIILLVVAAVFPNRVVLMMSLGFMSSPSLIRVARAATLSARNRLYVKAAEVVGLKPGRVVARHVLPAVTGPILVQVTVFIAAAVMIEASLGYLNLDTKPPFPSWGSMIADGAQVISQNSWLIIPPGIAIVLTGIALGTVGDAIREISAARYTWEAEDDTTTPATTPAAVAAIGPASSAATSSAGVSPASPAGPDVPVGPGVVEPDADRPVPVFAHGGDTLAASDDTVLLSVRDLSVTVTKHGAQTRLIDHVSFDIHPGECLGIVGESGCGKSITALAVLGLLPAGIAISHGSAVYDAVDLRTATPKQRRSLRGHEIAFISQEPMRALDPGATVGSQLKEVVRRTRGLDRKAATAEAARLLGQVQLPDPGQVMRRYPHELSGGMAQRVCIALALAGQPRLLIADEPTTALDVTVQAEILDLLRSLRESTGMAVMIVSHDCGVIADVCDRVAVMYAGQVVELADVEQLFARPMHPYSAALLAANPHGTTTLPLPSIPGRVPIPSQWPVSCRFADRCPHRTDACTSAAISLQPVGDDRVSRCVHPEQASKILETADV